MDANKIGNFITLLRKEKGMTQKELAEKLMVTDKAVSRWETGRGLPDTSLLTSLGEILGVSIEELLLGEFMEEKEAKEKSDKLILEALKYSSNRASDIITLFLILIGIAMLATPLFTTINGARIWIVKSVWIIMGLICIAGAGANIYLRKKVKSIKLSEKVFYILGEIFIIFALIFEILPLGGVMKFADGPNSYFVELNSYFDIIFIGYGDFVYMITGIFTVAAVLMGMGSLFKFKCSAKLRNVAFVCNVVSLIFSIMPSLLKGTEAMNWASYLICVFLFVSLIFQSMANRK